MTEQKIEAHTVTKPIQLLAAWLVGLILTNGAFLMTALNLEPQSWERSALVIAVIINVPLFLLALFVLQTRFRAELQEDTYYSDYLSKKTSAIVRIDTHASHDARLVELERQVLRFSDQKILPSVVSDDVRMHLNWSGWRIALNQQHPRFVEIRQALKEAMIPLAEVFGAPERPPEQWIISISDSFSAQYVVALLKVLLPFDFDGVQFWEPQREAEETEDVYIGSYGKDSYARITPELSTLIAGNADFLDLDLYSRRHQVKRTEAT